MTRRRGSATLAMIALMAQQAGVNMHDFLPTLPKPKPSGYRVHIPKALRKGKTWQELQAMRRERA